MKNKIIALLILALLMISCLGGAAMAIDVAPEFSRAFFPQGKVGTISDVYYQIERDEEDRPTYVYMWLTQPDDVIAMFSERERIGDEEWINTYNCGVLDCILQIDCSVDGGEWHYVPEWDRHEYPQADQPYNMVLSQWFGASDTQKTYCEGSSVISPYYGQDDESAGYLRSVIKSEDDTWYLDLENHSLALRARYLISYYNDNLSDAEREANGDSNISYLHSDWSDEITIGRGTNQIELIKPDRIDAPTLSDLSYIDGSVYEDGTIHSTWRVNVDFPKSNGAANKYYAVIDDYDSALGAIIQYRVQKDDQWSEWQDSYWGNPDWLDSGWKTFETEGVDKDDTIEFRVYLQNRVDEALNSGYSNSLFCNAADAEPAIAVPEGPVQPALLPPAQPAAEAKCKLCGICPIQPLGICLFIWIAIIVVIAIAIIILIVRAKNKNRRRRRRRPPMPQGQRRPMDQRRPQGQPRPTEQCRPTEQRRPQGQPRPTEQRRPTDPRRPQGERRPMDRRSDIR